MHPAILGIAVGSQLTMLVADQVPKLNVEATCKGSVAADKAMGLMLPQGFDKCMSDENSAQQQLVPIWSSYSAAIRAQCEGEATAAGSASYSYCVIIFCRLYVATLLPQQGHRGRVLMSALIRRMRMVAIEFGMWRSGRKGGSSGSIIVG